MEVAELINLATIGLAGLIWVSAATFLCVKKGKSLTYLFFFTIFYLYLYKVVDYTLLQFQSLLLLQYVLPGLMLNGYAEGESVNLIPLIALTAEGLKTSLLNILLFVPFGFGLPFITRLHFKDVVITGMFVSILIELLQFMTGYLAGVTFRVADINDILFNTTGVAVGYFLFVGFMRGYRGLSRVLKIPANPISSYILERPQP